MENLSSNNYLEELRDKVAADIYTKRVSQQLDTKEYDVIQQQADAEGLTITEYTAKRTIDLANTFITMLRREKLNMED